jgi:hypothetical protein
MMEFLIGWIVLCLLPAFIARSRGRSFIGVFVLSVILSPLIGLIVALVMRRGDQVAQETVVRGGTSSEYRKCPMCAEAVRKEAVKCKHCGAILTQEPVATTREPDAILKGAKPPPY